MTVRETIENHIRVDHYYLNGCGSPVDPNDYLDYEGYIEIYDDDDGEDDDGRPIIIRWRHFVIEAPELKEYHYIGKLCDGNYVVRHNGKLEEIDEDELNRIKQIGELHVEGSEENR